MSTRYTGRGKRLRAGARVILALCLALAVVAAVALLTAPARGTLL